MKIGIVGLGIVGGAIHHGFEKLGHQMKKHDIKYDTQLEDLQDTEIIFICVPTPSLDTGHADISIVTSIVKQLSEKLNYRGIVAIKSTVEPGTTEKLSKQYPQLKLCFVPEFLRERCAVTDFVENQDVCIIGTNDNQIYETLKQVHGEYPETFFRLSPTEAEIAKYFSNTYNAMLITFANAFYQICERLGADYSSVKHAMIHRSSIGNHYLECNQNLRGFGGACLPKDTRAIAATSKDLGLDIDLLKAIISDNNKYPPPPPNRSTMTEE